MEHVTGTGCKRPLNFDTRADEAPSYRKASIDEQRIVTHKVGAIARRK
jgi:hypothetical protein